MQDALVLHRCATAGLQPVALACMYRPKKHHHLFPELSPTCAWLNVCMYSFGFSSLHVITSQLAAAMQTVTSGRNNSMLGQSGTSRRDMW